MGNITISYRPMY